MTSRVESLLGGVPVIPVLVIDRLTDALPLAQALVEGGLPVLEVTLRTPVALAAVEQIAGRVAGAVVGVGSVVDPAQFEAAAAAGARFAVSPGTTPALADAAAMHPHLPWLPAAQTVSEALALRSRGYRFMKFFPAQSSGGAAALRAIAGPLPDLRFCPTGGVTADDAPEYLALPNVVCVGGSWLTPAAALRDARWDEVRRLAAAARALRQP